MGDKTKLTDETNFPIPVPSTDTGWEAMRKRLDDEMPAAAAVFANKDPEPPGSNKLFRLLLLLLFFLITGSVAIMIRKDRDGGNFKPATMTEKNSPNDKTKQDDKLNDAPNPDGDINTNKNSSGPDKKDIHNDLLSSGLATKSNSLVEHDKERVGGNNNQQPGLNISKKSKTGRNRNAMVRSKTFKSAKRQPDVKNQKADAALLNDNYVAGNSISTRNSIVQKTDSSTGSLSKSKPVIEKKSDSAAVDIPVPPSNSGWELAGGTYWVLQIPTAATGGYFLGANAHSQPQRIILPGAWLQAQNEKHLLTLELNPFASNLLPAKAFTTVTLYENVPDTTIITTETKTLQKIFGFSAGLGYAYNVSANWWLGGNIQTSWWRNAVATSKGEIKKHPINGSPELIIPFMKKYSIKDEWSFFSRVQCYINAEGLYRESKWQAGLRMGIAVTPLAKNDGPSQSLRLELLYRLKLFNRKVTGDKIRNAWVQ